MSGLREAASIIVPIYREAANPPALAECIESALHRSGSEWELLIVDDDSDDGSEALVGEFARRHPVRIVVRREPPRNLAQSVLLGPASIASAGRRPGRDGCGDQESQEWSPPTRP